MLNEENEMILKAVKWTLDAVEAERRAGGMTGCVLRSIGDEALITMIRNNIQLAYDSTATGKVHW